MRIPCPGGGAEYNCRMSAPAPVPFDSHQFVKRMTEAGMPLAQAEALAEEQGGMVNTHFATKQDTGELKHDVGGLKSDVGELKSDVGELKSDVGELKRDVGELKSDVGGLKRDVGELKSDVGGLKRDVGELNIGLAVVKAELGMVKWMMSGIGAGMLLLLVRTFWPI